MHPDGQFRGGPGELEGGADLVGNLIGGPTRGGKLRIRLAVIGSGGGLLFADYGLLMEDPESFVCSSFFALSGFQIAVFF